MLAEHTVRMRFGCCHFSSPARPKWGSRSIARSRSAAILDVERRVTIGARSSGTPIARANARATSATPSYHTVSPDTYTARSVSPRGSARDRLTALLVAEVQDDPEVRINSAAWGELRDTAIFDATLRPTIAALTEQWVHDLAVLVEEGRSDGSIPTTRTPKDLGVRLSAAVEGISARWLAGMLTTNQARRHITAIVHDLIS